MRRLDAQVDDHYAAWLPEAVEYSTINPARRRYSSLYIPAPSPNMIKLRQLLAQGSSIIDGRAGAKKFQYVVEREQAAAMALFGAKPVTGTSLQHLTKLVLKESAIHGKSKKTISKIKRGVDWYLEHIIQDDIEITLIDYDQVREFINADLIAGVAGSTLKGHLYGLRQIWNRAKQSRIVSGESPFHEHTIRVESKSYSPYTYHEIYELYNNAKGELKTLIHAAATTGARADELLTAEVKTPSTFNHPCWFIKLKQKGKTKQSTRVVPVHHSMDLSDGFQFKMKYKTAQTQMKELQENVFGTLMDELTEEPRKLTLHSLRSTVITELVVKHRINEKVVGGITGHIGGGSSRVGSLRGYIHTDDLNEKKSIVDLIPWAISSA
ncbi:tyrosine-type recombinase/integrase [Methylophaga nitratireducenticrescens]|uniref:tyrosine-type recombinase/integrase n=1 Tax=Methylophaga nitratireducenticrescens TaxID=754476 RepID=UPI000CDBDED9|nr:tyrosine-type recombinase/integrase [Methylophaga nitratireducenticrescens]AUZ84172.1 hypothetical protein CDW43_06105 [Methylophaga nitratireducenticrescens]